MSTYVKHGRVMTANRQWLVREYLRRHDWLRDGQGVFKLHGRRQWGWANTELFKKWERDFLVDGHETAKPQTQHHDPGVPREDATLDR